MNLALRSLTEIIGDVAHRPGGGTRKLGPAGRQIFGELINGPVMRSDKRRVERGRIPAFGGTAGVGTALLFTTKRIARRVTGSAMSQSLDQIAAAIPFYALAGVFFQEGLAKKQNFPSGDDRAEAEWKRKLICRDNVADRRYAHQERIEGVNIFICRLGEMIIGKCWVELLSFAIDALVHGATERIFRPSPNSCFKVRRQIAGVDRSEWRRQCPATCIGHVGIFCMAIAAVANGREFSALINHFPIRDRLLR